MNSERILMPVAVVIAVAGFTFDCDPAGPAVEGAISLGEEVDTAAFKVTECGGTFDGYCDTTQGVDFTIDTQIP